MNTYLCNLISILSILIFFFFFFIKIKPHQGQVHLSMVLKLNIPKPHHHQMMIGVQNLQNQDGNVQEDHQKVQIEWRLVVLWKV